MPASSAAASTLRASSASRAKGFSADHVLAGGDGGQRDLRVGVGRVAMVTAATPPSCNASSTEVSARGMSKSRARSEVRSGSRPTRATTSKPAARRARTWVTHPKPVTDDYHAVHPTVSMTRRVAWAAERAASSGDSW